MKLISGILSLFATGFGFYVTYRIIQYIKAPSDILMAFIAEICFLVAGLIAGIVEEAEER